MTQPVHSYEPRLSQTVIAQLLAAFPLALVLACFRDGPAVALGSVLLGAAIAIGVSAWFGWRAFATGRAVMDEAENGAESGAENRYQLLGRLYRAELGKFLAAALLLGLAFKYGEILDRLAILLGFIAAWLAGALAIACVSQAKNEDG